ncbi:hypothetical protein MTR67_005146 [Solanum verrucosum]|uniref:Uncharacterized protein n=1 Tax=Solanum verrucosum TaxID=315347 RepID=A0AAF0PVT1_SOLVR|nr:hypothetical protein MTR67_005146 [Solanum verrucosum]
MLRMIIMILPLRLVNWKRKIRFLGPRCLKKHYTNVRFKSQQQVLGETFDEEEIKKKVMLRLGTGLDRNQRTGMNRYRTGKGRVDRFVDRYRDELDVNYRDILGSVPSYYNRDGIGPDRNRSEWNGMG